MKLLHIYIHLPTISRFFNNLRETGDLRKKKKQPKKFDLIKPDDKTQGQKNITPKYKVIH